MIRDSGLLFRATLYFNSIIMFLKTSDLGCHIDGMFVGCIAYADDIILLSASVVNLLI